MKPTVYVLLLTAIVICSPSHSANEAIDHRPEGISKAEKSLFEQLEEDLQVWRSYFDRRRRMPAHDPNAIAALHHCDKLELALSGILDAERHRVQMGFVNNLLLIRETMTDPERDLTQSALILELRLTMEFKRQREQTELDQIMVAQRLLRDWIAGESADLMYKIYGKHTLELFQAIGQEIQEDRNADRLFLQRGLALSESEMKQYRDVLLLAERP